MQIYLGAFSFLYLQNLVNGTTTFNTLTTNSPMVTTKNAVTHYARTSGIT